MTDQPTLPVPGYCWRCGGTGRVPAAGVIATGRTRAGREPTPVVRPEAEHELVRFEVPCADCQPADMAADRWRQAWALGR